MELAVSEGGLGFERGLIHQHDGDVVFHRIHPVTLGALQTLGIWPILQRLLARRTDQHLQ